MTEINYVCSLGPFCHTAGIFKRTNLKLDSYPFDWIFSNCDTILNCLEDNFKTFLDKSYYISATPSRCGHRIYIPNDTMWRHHNPLLNEEHYNYYRRCIIRFRILLQKKEHKLFSMLFVNMNEMDETEKDRIVGFNNAFSTYTENYTLLVIFHIQNKNSRDHVFHYKDNIHFLELHTTSTSTGLEFTNNDDNLYLDKIIQTNYNINSFQI